MRAFLSDRSEGGIPAGYLDMCVSLDVCSARAALDEAARILAEAMDLARQGQVAIWKARSGVSEGS